VGDTNAAVLAWNRYLELAPNGTMAETVKQQVALLTTPATTSGGPTTTAPVSPTTTAK
jgi:hypothetical protein